MAIITDPDNLTRSIVIIDTTAKTIGLTIGGALTTDGVTLKALYSFLKEEWISDNDLIKFAFPMLPITDEQFEIFNGWNFLDNDTRYLIRTGGWAVKDDNGVSTEEWAGVVTLGSLGVTDQVYFQQKTGGTATNIQLQGVVNQAIKIYDVAVAPKTTASRYRTTGVAGIATSTAHGLNIGDWVVVKNVGGTGYNGSWQVSDVTDTTHFNYVNAGTDEGSSGSPVADVTGATIQEYRHYFKIFCREYAKTYATASLSDIGVTAGMTYQVYRFPLSNAADLKIVDDDTVVDAGLDHYAGLSITWYNTPQTITGFVGGDGDFHVIIEGGTGIATAEEIYTYVQRQLRKNSDIDAGSGTVIGKTANELVLFVGESLKTKLYETGKGTYIQDFATSDTNRLTFIDDSGADRTYPFVAALTLQFGANLIADASSIYRVFFTNDDAATVPQGNDFGTENAILCKDAASVDMAGSISGASIALTFAYDSNVQRGAGSEGEDAPITVVGIGLQTAQYVLATGTITRSTTNSVSLVAPLERNYSNP